MITNTIKINPNDLEIKYEFKLGKEIGSGDEGGIYRVADSLVVKLPTSEFFPRLPASQVFNARKEYFFATHLKENGINVPSPLGVYRVLETATCFLYPGYVMEYWGSGNAKTFNEITKTYSGHKLTKFFEEKRALELEKAKKLGFFTFDARYSGNTLIQGEEICLIDFLGWKYYGKKPGLSIWNSFEEYYMYWEDHE